MSTFCKPIFHPIVKQFDTVEMNIWKNNYAYPYGNSLYKISVSKDFYKGCSDIFNGLIYFDFDNKDLLILKTYEEGIAHQVSYTNYSQNSNFINTYIHKKLININNFIIFPTKIESYDKNIFEYTIMLLDDFTRLKFIKKFNLDDIIIKQPLIYNTDRNQFLNECYKKVHYNNYIDMSTFYQIKLDLELHKVIADKYMKYQIKNRYYKKL